MNIAISSILLTFFASILLVYQTSAKNTACFNANGDIKRIFCDGRDITKRLVGRSNPKKCGCLMLDVCSNITIRAVGYQHRDKGQTRSAVGLCQTSRPTQYRGWVCMKSHLNKGWKDQTMNVRNSQLWHPPKKTTSSRRCYKKQKLPYKPPMFWNAGVDAPSIDCVLQQCADECQSCSSTGPGKCDPGMCTYGAGQNHYTNKTRCNRECRLDLAVWGQRNYPGATGNGYMRLVDMRSKSRDIIRATKPGGYLALVDMDQCVFSEKYYAGYVIPDLDKIRAFNQDSTLKLWIYDDAKMVNRIAVYLEVGGFSSGSVYSLSPYMAVYTLGVGRAEPLFSGFNCAATTVLKGFNYAPTTVESADILVSGTINDPNTGC